MEDLELIRRFVQGGDQEAFAELVRRHVDLVYSAAVRQVGAAHAEDICQDVFLELARRAGNLREDSSVGTWLYVVTRRTAVDWIRKESRRAKRERAAGAEEAIMGESTNEVPPESDWSRMGPRLDVAMDELPDDDRRAVVMRFFEHRRLKEIAATMRVSEDAAQKRISRAVDKLRDGLAARGFVSFAAVITAELAAGAVQPAPTGLAANLAWTSKGSAAATSTGKWVSLLLGALTAAVAIGFAVSATRKARTEEAHRRLLEDQLNHAQFDLLAEEAALRKAQVPAVRVPLVKSGGAEADRALQAKAAGLLRAVDNLRKHLKSNPARMIPEMRLLTDKDWLEVAHQFPDPKTDADYRKAFSRLRAAAKAELVPLMSAALGHYEDDHGGNLPSDPLQLASYFEPPVGDDILARYAVAQHPGPIDSERTIYERPSAFVDDVYENAVTMGVHGWAAQSSDEPTDTSFALRMAVSYAMRAFRSEHPNQKPVGEALVPYFSDPADAQRWLAARGANR